jgi:hypothetical protein
MDASAFSRDRLLLSCESNQRPFGSWPLRPRTQKKPTTAITEPDRENGGIPAGFPKSIVSPTAWTGADFENDPGRERYTLSLNDVQINELEQACHNFKGTFVRKLHCRPCCSFFFSMMTECVMVWVDADLFWNRSRPFPRIRFSRVIPTSDIGRQAENLGHGGHQWGRLFPHPRTRSAAVLERNERRPLSWYLSVYRWETRSPR